MNCKNCQTKLKENAKFCTKCGAKVINHKLTFSSVMEEFFATFISWDNKFLKTFIHLTTKPQEVVNGYLDGLRKRYMQPFAYMIIALTLYGIYMYFAKDMLVEYLEAMNESMAKYSDPNASEKVKKIQENYNKTMFNYITKYYNIFTFWMIPFLAFFNKILFKKRNFIEHNIALLYAFATYLFYSSIVGFIAILLQMDYQNVYLVIMLLMIVYHMYFYKKMFQLDIGTTILKTLLFWLLLIAFFVVLFIIAVIVVVVLLKLKILTP